MFLRAVCIFSGLCALLPARASACDGDLCEGVAAVLDVAPASSAAVPTDGVLVLTVDTIGGLKPPQIRERVTLAVTLDGQPVAGALESVEVGDLMVWRPTAPLQAGAHYEVSGTIANSSGAEAGCGAEMQALAFDFAAADGPTAPLVAPTLTIQPTFFNEPILTLAGVVCCDDAMPADQVLCGVSYGITWEKGQCAATETRGYLRLLLIGATEADAASSGQWVRVLLQDGERVAASVGTGFQRQVDAPACFTILQRSLATGEAVMSAEQCVGEDRADELGILAVDPVETLAGRCINDLYTCEIRSGRWDPLRCTSYGPDSMTPGDAGGEAETDGQVGEGGCGCTAAPTDAASGLLALLLLGRRRSRRRGAARAGA